MTSRATLLVGRLSELAVPRRVGEFWYKPALSRRQLAELRKTPEFEGLRTSDPETFAKFSQQKHGSFTRLTNPKGHKHERLAAARAASIQRKLEEMPRLVEDMRKAKRQAKEAVGISWLFKETGKK